MALYEVVLELDGQTELRLTDEPLTKGQTVEIAGERWTVTHVVRPEAPAAAGRFVVRRMAPAPSPAES